MSPCKWVYGESLFAANNFRRYDGMSVAQARMTIAVQVVESEAVGGLSSVNAISGFSTRRYSKNIAAATAVGSRAPSSNPPLRWTDR